VQFLAYSSGTNVRDSVINVAVRHELLLLLIVLVSTYESLIARTRSAAFSALHKVREHLYLARVHVLLSV
jgi:hypothetical protein